MTISIKDWLNSAATGVAADRLFRHLNRQRLLVVMYHGVTRHRYDPPVWAQLPVERFRSQLDYLAKHYRPISLETLQNVLGGREELPERAALVTFDDGLKNNLTVAFPLLKERNIPAAIFLCTDLVGTDEIFWFDRLYLIIREAAGRIELPLPDPARSLVKAGRPAEAYAATAEMLKRCGKRRRDEILGELADLVPVTPGAWREDFGLLDWRDVKTMQDSHLVEFGVHTATHRILTELGEEEWHGELHAPRLKLARETGREVRAFCYPNGRPGTDFRPEHGEYLRKAGYSCAFSTQSALFDVRDGDQMAISRIPAGNDRSSLPSTFRLNTSGFTGFVKHFPRHAPSLPVQYPEGSHG